MRLKRAKHWRIIWYPVLTKPTTRDLGTDLDLQESGGPSHQDPKNKRDPASKITFSALQATVWPKYKVGARAPPLDPSMFSLTLHVQFRPSLRITVPFLIIDLLAVLRGLCHACRDHFVNIRNHSSSLKKKLNLSEEITCK